MLQATYKKIQQKSTEAGVGAAIVAAAAAVAVAAAVVAAAAAAAAAGASKMPEIISWKEQLPLEMVGKS